MSIKEMLKQSRAFQWVHVIQIVQINSDIFLPWQKFDNDTGI